ncbi:hypothetical protein DL93DRAFT_2233614 [Clavulina sp. PMI_390]|nr:hypothetical protein DL93DRAFT_2233614 [Clavulina sp. PMI_390]
MSPSISHRQSVAFSACLVIIILTLLTGWARDVEVPIESHSTTVTLELNTPVEVVISPATPVRPDQCDPSIYPLGSLENRLLSPQVHYGPVWEPENRRQFKRWCDCQQTDSCAPNQREVVLLSVHHFQTWYKNSIDSSNGGETVWGVSIIESLRLLGYTFFYVDSFVEIQEFYRILSVNVLAIIMSDEHIYECWNDQENCVKSRRNPLGPPIWKFFTFHFWPDAQHPLGHPWTLAPEDYSLHTNNKDVNTYLGYSVEPSCNSQPVVSQVDRLPKSVYAMMKCISYLAPQRERAWPPSFYQHATQKLGVHFTIGAVNTTDPTRCGGNQDLVKPQLSEFGGEEVMKNIGPLDRPDFLRKVAESKVLLGVGRPAISPTPYQALCVGVPFINPILDWDRNRPEDRGAWNTQHNGLRDLNPPYVYHVFKDDQDGLLSALSQAMERPVSRFIPPGVSLKEVAERLNTILRRNWMRAAEDLLGERIRNKGERFTL